MKSFLFLMALFLLSSCGNKELMTQYDAACSVFDVARKNSSQLVLESLLDELKAKVGDASEAYVSLSILLTTAPNDRYPEFKYTAEQSLGEKWGCESMKLLAPSVEVIY